MNNSACSDSDGPVRDLFAEARKSIDSLSILQMASKLSSIEDAVRALTIERYECIINDRDSCISLGIDYVNPEKDCGCVKALYAAYFMVKNELEEKPEPSRSLQ